jgi:hypothetical protein
MKFTLEIDIKDEYYSDLVALYSSFEKELMSIGYTDEDIRNYYRMHFGITGAELQKLRENERGH